MKIYTRTGDAGQTALGNGTRVAKHSPRVSAYGTVDETNATVGLARLHAEGEMAEALKRICAARGIGLSQSIAVGDGANDLDMLTLAGTGVALHAKPAVAAQARIRIDHGDLTALLYLQGYRDRDFVGG